MLKSELSNVEDCVGIIVNTKEIISEPGNAVVQAALYERLVSSCTELKQRMISEVFGSAKDHVIRRYVQFHQAGLITLSDIVFQHVRKVEVPLIPGKSELLIKTLSALQQLLEFIARQFYAYFDLIHGITQYESDLTSNQFRSKIETLAPLLERQPIEPSLVNVFFRSMEDSLDQLRVQTISYEQAIYVDQLLRLIQLKLEEGNTDTIRFTALLYQQNFNSTYFESWYRQTHLTVQNGGTHVESKRLIIEPISQVLGISAGRKPLDMLLRDWLSDHIATGPQSATRKIKQEVVVPRLPLILSVPQLALFVRLCYLEGCFQISNISNIMRFFTDHFETKKQPHVSVKSFSRAFYSADQATAAMVRDFLQRMIIMIDKTYFPKT
ncbi:hypothetical protein [Mucilaginibacter agri]|uniref:Uncharacterized protein n=1 Tax=Mucilaginibacter agri TaxID=2695265 RepID=A0A965ZD35_9SPHI|nr:hypothetical protein [Mucilaginibacter agri]NCD68068.1 hypothetical protein [Mucilaginibacter agri]